MCETLNKAKADAETAKAEAAKAKVDADKAKPDRRLSVTTFVKDLTTATPGAKNSVKKEFWVFGTGQMMSVDYLFDRLGVDAVEPAAAYTCDYSVDGLVTGQDMVEPVYGAVKVAKDPVDLAHGTLFRVTAFGYAKLQA